jgi:hypothetical protein
MSLHFLTLILVLLRAHAHAQSPSLFLTLQDFQERSAIAEHEPWAKASLEQLIREANAFPKSYEKRFGLQSVELPPEGGQWLHWYVCPDTGTPLTFRPPNHNVCPDTGKEFPGYPYDQVVYQLRNDALRRAALTLALSYRFTNDQRYAREAIEILSAYADHYKSWPLHDNHGKPTANGGKAYSQTLDESIWLIDIAWTYDLVRGSGLLYQKQKAHIENDLLRASYETVSKAHKEPTDNIQSWINAAIAAVGFTLHDEALIHEAIDGPIGFRYQMHHFVIQGFWIEGAFGYQFYAMRALVATAQMAMHAGINLWLQEPALLSLFKGPMGVVLPNGDLPSFNDSNQVDLYDQDYLYEQAYAAVKDPVFLPIMTRYGRTNREALLFGVADIPKPQPLSLKSEVFADAGYAALRNSRNDLTVIAKFGRHGGAHGHYDKLSFVLYSQGRVMGIDPGTQLYGLPLHQQWDSMTIAHNTVSVDEQRQSAATGKLVDWHTDANSVSVTMDAGPVYKDVSFRRSILLTPNYCVVADRVDSSTSHTVDWIYHNVGSLDIAHPHLNEPVSNLPTQGGYSLLKDVRGSLTDGEFKGRFVDASGGQSKDDSNPNSPPATTRAAGPPETKDRLNPGRRAIIELVIPADGSQELMSGVAPGHDLKKPVPFVLARKRGQNVTFTAVLSPLQCIVARQADVGPRRALRISGPGFADEISVDSTVSLKRESAPSR